MAASTEGSVLVIEDDEDTAKLIRLVLTRQGFVIAHAGDGATGLSSYRERPPDCLVLDVHLPDMNGWEILRQIRVADDLTQVLMLTAEAAPEQRALGLAHGADDYLAKPFEAAELVERVRKRVQARERLREIVRRYSDTIPHELGQPLALIVGYSQLIQDPRRSPEELRQMALVMGDAARRLGELVHKFGQLRDYQTRHFGGRDLIALDPEATSEAP